MGVWPFGSSSPPDPGRDTTTRPSPPSPPASAPTPPEDDDDDDENPFIVFRRAVDDQFRLMAAGLSSIPSILHELQTRGESDTPSPATESTAKDSRWSDRSFAERADQPLAFMSQHFEQIPFGRSWRRGPPPSEEAFAAARSVLLQSRNACAQTGVNPMDILRLYQDPDAAHPFFAHHEPAWLSVQWFQASPYSPAQLETHPRAHQHGSMWRAAFEDLLSTSTGREPVARDAWTGARQDQKLYHTWAQTPRDWMLGLQCRGVLPPQLPSLYRLNNTRHMDHIFMGLVHGMSARELGPWGHAPRRDLINLAREIGTFDADELPQCNKQPAQRASRDEAPIQKQPQIEKAAAPSPAAQPREQETTKASELDAYEHFLGKANAEVPSTSTTSASQQDLPAKQSQPVSTFSTTERTTHPDGSVTTKVMVRKVFADGSEQETKSESTTLRQETEGGQQQGREQEVAKQAKRSWFWR